MIMSLLMTTTHTLPDKTYESLGLVSGEAIMGTNIVRDLFANITDVIGGRSATYEKGLREGKYIAMLEMEDEARKIGGNAVIGIDLDYQTVGTNSSMLMVVAAGTAIRIRDDA